MQQNFMRLKYNETNTFLDHVIDEVKFCDLYKILPLGTTFQQLKPYETLIIISSKIKKLAKLNLFLFAKLLCGQHAKSANSSAINNQPVMQQDITLVLVECLGSTFHVSFTKRWNGSALYALATQCFSCQETHLFCICKIQIIRTQFMVQQLK